MRVKFMAHFTSVQAAARSAQRYHSPLPYFFGQASTRTDIAQLLNAGRGQPGYSRLQKVKGFLDLMRAQFSTVYSPNACISVDEAMIPFKGESILLTV